MTVSGRWKPGSVLLPLLLVLALAIFPGRAEAAIRRVLPRREDAHGNVGTSWLLLMGICGRYGTQLAQWPPAPPPPPPPPPPPSGTFAPNSYTQAAGVSFDTNTGHFSKASWYFGAIPARRYDPAVGVNDQKPANGAALIAAFAALAGKTDPIIEVTTAATYSNAANFSIPAKTWNGTLVFRAGSLAGIPVGIDGGTATRVGPGNVGSMTLLQQTGTNPVLNILASCQDVWIEGIEFGASTAATSNLILAGHPNNGVNTLAKVPQRIAFVHNYMHGHVTNDSLRAGLFECSQLLFADNYSSDWRGVGMEGQGFTCIGFTPGSIDVVNNYLSALGECSIFGGGDTTLGGVEVWPEDVYFAHNYLFKPLAWVTAPYSANQKNLWEWKKGARCTVVGNVMQGCWKGAQAGEGVAIKNTNQAGANPNQLSTDITLRFNIIRDSGGVFQVITGENNTVNFPLGRVEARDWLCYRINSATYNIDPTGGHPTFLSLVGSTVTLGTPGRNFRFLHNTVSVVNAGPYATIGTGQTNAVVPWPLFDDIAVQNNILPKGFYGWILGDATAQGAASVTGRWINAALTRNVLVGGTGPAASYPGQYFEATEAGVGYTNLAGENFQIVAGTQYSSTGARQATDAKDQGADIVNVLYHTNGVT